MAFGATVKISADMNVSALIQHLTQVQPKQELESGFGEVFSAEPASEATEKVADSQLDSGADLLATDVWEASDQKRAVDLIALSTPPVTSLDTIINWADYVFGRDPMAI